MISVPNHRSADFKTRTFKIVLCLLISGGAVLGETVQTNVSYVGVLRDTVQDNSMIALPNVEVTENEVSSKINLTAPNELPLMSMLRPANLSAWETRVGSKMAWLSGLFDHHEWTMHLGNVTESCAADLTTYVTALKAGQLWASKMYDSSGHYNPNMLFGNEYWLGSLHACRDLSLRRYYAQVPPYAAAAAYHVATFNVSLDDGHTPQSKAMLLGTCLPASCGAADIARVLESSAREHVRRGRAGAAAGGGGDGGGGGAGVRADVLVQAVRAVPGAYAITEDPKFLILGSVMLIVGTVMLVASLYEGWLERVERRESTGRQRDLEMSNNNNTDHTKPNNNTEECLRQRANGVKTPPPASAPEPEKSKSEARRPTTGLFSEILLSFSVLSNGRKMLSTEKPADGALTCLHGMRFLSVVWVIMVHTYLTLFYISDNKTLRTVTERNFLYQSVGNASYSVDTFFFIGGLLVTILFLRTEDKKAKANETKSDQNKNGFTNPALSVSVSVISQGSVSPDLMEDPKSHITFAEFTRNLRKFLVLLFYRVARLTPAYSFVIGINELALRYSHNNSVFEPAIFDHITCDLYWWRNVLYINNLYPQREMCMVWSWYMANDTQFYVVGMILLLISVKSPKFSLISTGVLMVSSWVTTIYISWSYQYKARIQDPFEMFDPLYDKPWARLGPYLVGMGMGWYLHKTKCQVRLPVWLVLLGWPAAIAIMGALIFGMVDGYFEVWPTAFYVSIGHTAWGVALAWVTLCCCCGYGGLVNSILSYRGVLPLSKLTYCAYLVHPTIMMYTSFLMDGPFHLQNSMVLVTYAGYAVFSFLASLGISLAFEAPIIRLMKIGISGPDSRGE